MSIQYAEKGAGLHAAVSAAGHWLAQLDGIWTSSNDSAVQAIIDGYTLARAKADRCAAVSAHAKELRDRVVGTISAGEMASWPIKRTEAAAFQIDSGSSCPMLEGEAQNRGVSVAALVVKVQANSAKFSAVEGMIGGVDGKHRDAIAGLTTFEQVAAYDFSVGWPAV